MRRLRPRPHGVTSRPLPMCRSSLARRQTGSRAPGTITGTSTPPRPYVGPRVSTFVPSRQAPAGRPQLMASLYAIYSCGSRVASTASGAPPRGPRGPRARRCSPPVAICQSISTTPSSTVVSPIKLDGGPGLTGLRGARAPRRPKRAVAGSISPQAATSLGGNLLDGAVRSRSLAGAPGTPALIAVSSARKSAGMVFSEERARRGHAQPDRAGSRGCG